MRGTDITRAEVQNVDSVRFMAPNLLPHLVRNNLGSESPRKRLDGGSADHLVPTELTTSNVLGLLANLCWWCKGVKLEALGINLL